MNNSYKISIIMPSLNVVEYIDECIMSAINQTLKEIEIICIDAGSTDGTFEKLLNYQNQYKNVKVLKSNIKSYGYQVNLGIKESKGKYVAILETDDFVKEEMYEYLYELAENNNAEIVKADFCSFITYFGGKRIFEKTRTLSENDEKYEKVLDPRYINRLYTSDYSVWKGIYNRSFLISNNIFFNESKGAAFQDIGFMMQVLSCAQRALYTDRFFYCYRVDRIEASSNSVYGLEYSYNEFKRIFETPELLSKMTNLTGVYFRMVQSFITELIKTLRALNYDLNSEYIYLYYLWFKERIENSEFKTELFDLFPELFQIIYNIDEYIYKLRKSDEEDIIKERKLLSIVKDKEIVVFGAGNYGKNCIELLYKNNIRITAVCDNNKLIWNTEKYFVNVYSPEVCVDKFKDALYIIANKLNKESIHFQLLSYGVKEENIYIYQI